MYVRIKSAGWLTIAPAIPATAPAMAEIANPAGPTPTWTLHNQTKENVPVRNKDLRKGPNATATSEPTRGATEATNVRESTFLGLRVDQICQKMGQDIERKKLCNGKWELSRQGGSKARPKGQQVFCLKLRKLELFFFCYCSIFGVCLAAIFILSPSRYNG